MYGLEPGGSGFWASGLELQVKKYRFRVCIKWTPRPVIVV